MTILYLSGYLFVECMEFLEECYMRDKNWILKQ